MHAQGPWRLTGSVHVIVRQAPQPDSGRAATTTELLRMEAKALPGYPLVPTGPKPQLPPAPTCSWLCPGSGYIRRASPISISSAV